jgi:hypothetical protein
MVADPPRSITRDRSQTTLRLLLRAMVVAAFFNFSDIISLVSVRRTFQLPTSLKTMAKTAFISDALRRACSMEMSG